LFCALLARLLVPAGWMPAAHADGFRLIPCGGTAPASTASGHHSAHAAHAPGQPDDGAPDDGADEDPRPCAFALAAAAALDPRLPDPAVPPRPAPAPARPRAVAAAAVGRGLAAPPPPATGPPASA
jgi:hypothetical protein